jgi:integrase/recombinase XerD
MKLATAITQYIAYRRGLGELYETNGRMLIAFGRAMGLHKRLASVHPKQVSRFLHGGGPITANWHAKYQALRGFYRYVISRGYIASSPLPTAVPKRPPPFVPYIYTRRELRSLLKVCLTYQKNRSRIDPVMMQTMLLLLYGAGLRVREAIRLTLADVDLNSNCLTIQKTKFRKTRLVPFGAQLAKELKRYAVKRRCGDLPQQPDAVFFISLIAWYKQGADVQSWLPVLSTYLGHTYLAATSVYLTMTPVLLAQANRRFQHYAFPENTHD